MPHIEVLIGSPSDLPPVRESALVSKLQAAGFAVAVSACSAHRNTVQLGERIDQTIGHTNAYVCCAGWAAALPGAVKALLLGKSLATVYGIALPSEAYPDGGDAEVSIKRLPPGVDVVYGGVGTEGLDSIIDQVIASATAYDPSNPDLDELQRVKDKVKKPQFDINLEED